MDDQAIRYAVVDGIASITLNRPEKRNALDLAREPAMFAGLWAR